jgi:hypothetical protein
MEVYYEGKNNITQLPIDKKNHEVKIDDTIAKLTPGEGFCHVVYSYDTVVMNLKMDAEHPAYTFTCKEGTVTFRY